jgi:LacI family transcriptional regulator
MATKIPPSSRESADPTGTAARHIVLLMHRWVGYLYGVQLGIAEYLLHRPALTATQYYPEPDQIGRMLNSRVDGIIVFSAWHYPRELLQLKVPIVDVSNWQANERYLRVLPDDYAIGRLAADYLLDLGLRNFGFLGLAGVNFSVLRRKGFIDALASQNLVAEDMREQGYTFPPDTTVPANVSPAVLAWLLALPKPAGIFCSTDNRAAEVLEVCRLSGIRVPEDVCVLGVDNDELVTKVTHPPLSSIALPTHKIGFEAARLLDELMSGGERPAAPILFPPTGVVARQSTNLLSIADPDVLAAVRYIREQVHRQVTVRDLLRAVPVNRRYLERKFKQHLGRTPLQEIRRVRLEKAKQLLSETELSMPAVARRSGFPNAARLANVFHDGTGMTPSQYRKAFRLQDQ